MDQSVLGCLYEVTAMMKKITAFLCLCALLLSMAGCVGQSSAAAEGYDTLGGTWEVGGIYYRNKIIDIHDNDTLEGMYDSTILEFREDGTFTYMMPLIFKGDYTKSTSAEDDSFILTLTTKVNIEGDKMVEEPYDRDTKYIITLIDEKTFSFSGYDPVTGKAKANDDPLVFVKQSTDNTDNDFIDENKKEISIKIPYNSNNNEKTTPNTISQGSSYGQNSYEGILNTYTRKMNDALPGLISAYRSEASGVSDINRLAEICNDKISKLAEICNEGVSEMAELMYSRGDAYGTYESWSGKLMDNYSNIAGEIQDVYIFSASY